jgi:hypothetical protein
MSHRIGRGVDIFAISSPTLERISRYTKANHRVFMQFIRCDVRHVIFLAPGLQNHFQNADL